MTVDPGGESKTITELALMNYGAWDTVPQGSYAVLAVYRNGKRLNPADEAVSDAISGKTTYELYAGDYGYFGDPKDDR